MTNFDNLTLDEINAQIELLEVAERFGAKTQQFTDWLSTFAGGEVVNWVSDDETVRFILGGLKDAAFEFSETLGGYAENFEPLTDAAGTAGNINTAIQTALSIVTAIEEADEAVGADKAAQLAGILNNLTAFSQLLTGLSLNPIIGVFIGLYATALQNAVAGIQVIADSVAIRDEVIESSTEGIDIAAAQAAQQAAEDAAAENQLALTEELNGLYAARADRIAALQGTQYTVALDFAASRHPEEMRELIGIATEHGGVTSNAPVNGATLSQLEAWVISATEAAFDLMTEAAAAPEGSEARANALESLNTLNDARRGVTELLGPIRGTVTGALETYGYSTADPEPQAAMTGGAVGGASAGMVAIGVGVLILAAAGLASLFAGGGDGGASTVGSASSAAVSSSSPSSSDEATPSSRSGRAPKPVVIQPCLVIDQARATALLGTAIGPSALKDEENDKTCGWLQAEDSDPSTSISIWMKLKLNSAGFEGLLRNWRSGTPDASEVRTIPWSKPGELRIEIDTVDEYATVALYAPAFDSASASGDVYVKLAIRGPISAAASMATMAETIAEELRDAVLAAQP
jgi:hypothetical protein